MSGSSPSEPRLEPENVAALTVYERAGFEVVGERLGFLIMRRRLPVHGEPADG